MEVHLSPEKEARLRQCAARAGKDASVFLEEAVDRLLEYESHFIDAVEKGRAAVRDGRLLEHEEVVERIEQILRS